MTRSTSSAIAAILVEQRQRASAAERWRLDETARAMADYFASVNDRFDRPKFLAACDVDTAALAVPTK